MRGALTLFCLLGLLSLGQGISAQDYVHRDVKLKALEVYYKGLLAQSLGKPDEARLALEEAHKLWTKNGEIAYELGSLYRRQEQYDKAQPLLLQAYNSDTTNQDYLLALASLYSEEDKQSEASRILEEWLHRYPTDADALQQLIKIYFRAGDYTQALALYSRLQSQVGDSYEDYERLTFQKVRLLQAINETGQVFNEFNTLVEKYPEEETPRWVLLNFLRENQRYGEMMPHLEALVSMGVASQRLRDVKFAMAIEQDKASELEALIVQSVDDEDASVLSVLGILRRYQVYLKGQGEQALTQSHLNDYYQRLLKKHRDEQALIISSYVTLLEERKDYDLAIKYLRDALQIEPEEPSLWNSLFQMAINKEEDELIYQVAQEALQYIKADFRYYLATSIGYFQEGKLPSAISTLKEGIEHLRGVDKKGLSKLLENLGDLYYEQGDKKEAYASYEEALENNPDNTGVLNNYAYFLAESKQELDKAERMAAKAISLDASNANALDTYAWIFYLKGNMSLAKLYQSKALDLAKAEGQVSATLYEHLGYIQLAQQDLAEARESWQEAVRLLREEMDKISKSSVVKQRKKDLQKKQATLNRLEKELNKLKDKK